MKLHLVGDSVRDYHLVKSFSSDSWRFAFRVYKVMVRYGILYMDAKKLLLDFSRRKDEQLEIARQRFLDFKQFGQCPPPPGIEEIREDDSPDDDYFGDVVNDDVKVDFIPPRIVAYDRRVSDFYEIFVHCTRQGFCCSEFGTDSERIYFYYNGEVRVAFRRRDPMMYQSKIEDRVRNAVPAPVDCLEKFCKAVDVPYDINFYNIFSNSVPIENFFPYDYREECEIFLDFLDKGWSARNVGFDGETFFFLIENSIYRTNPQDPEYTRIIFDRQKCSKYYKTEAIIENFIKCFDLELEQFNLALNVFKGLNGGASSIVIFYPDRFEVSIFGEYEDGYSRIIKISDILNEKAIKDYPPNINKIISENKKDLIHFWIGYVPDDKIEKELLVFESRFVLKFEKCTSNDCKMKFWWGGPVIKDHFLCESKVMESQKVEIFNDTMLAVKTRGGRLRYRMILTFSMINKIDRLALYGNPVPRKRTFSELNGAGPNGILN